MSLLLVTSFNTKANVIGHVSVLANNEVRFLHATPPGLKCGANEK